MPSLAHACLLAGLIVSGTAAAKETAMSKDPYAWLEDVTGAKPLDWVKAQNAKTEARLSAQPGFQAREAGIREVLDSDAKIPTVQKIGPYYYNLWKDRAHERGLWRRTTLDEYRKPEPKWETVLDLDALNKAEGENWVWHSADCLRPDYRRCLITLSRGGADADVTREFDLGSKQWVKDGFFRPEAKGGLSWIDADSVYLYTDFGAGSLTSSGYPRVVKQWKRGTPQQSASLVYEGKPEDMQIDATHDDTPGYERDFVSRTLAFYNDELYLRSADGSLRKVDAPNSARKRVHREWLTLQLREPWTVGGTTYPAGTLLAAKFDDFMAGKRAFRVLFAPTESTSLKEFKWTKSTLVLNVLDNVKSRLWVLTPGEGEWARAPFPVGDLAFGSIRVDAVDADENDQVWLTSTDFLTPTTLLLADVQRGPQSIEALKAMPSFFDASKDAIEQHFAVSKDGTKVPYFLVRPKQLKLDGSHPTLLSAYGGFEISVTPFYSGGLGRGWLDQGGVYALANIRGGGEYGPRWHQAALKQNRHKAYEDMAAVAQDLAARKITSARHLGVQGGSNGGLMAGNMLVQYPQLFGAVVVQAPLLDMKRYSHLLAGASWMDEFGNPDTDDWTYIRTFSPYHLFDPKKAYPPVIFMTSTRDDRVHPGHARKMAAKMIDAGKDVTYYENTEGGHGGAANNAQAAHAQALEYGFLWERLKD
ncbi:prolyl oligopeptidase family serine peptidase [Xanthomonas translucens pv. translucens]|uniref:prolyl oligopeptidase family serine peptidase n=1 Tax=Xanthomonas campestris pv. translucens TaxID=343 RepID=UPI0007628C35|nr:prolyl oligopeptidase family serine peptidase [Xanthomonas translucens]KWV13212.1 prolyl oligopeptidase [Xanthomonas translucens]MCS3361807.1 prolyl oligopeptidase family serine peptidase [Xanthomonas translucens pv. translucens]MCS3375389.1 prolyl oligopeptidase family serine peptidase [Xanthomonas translucens pv. translucens]MCT8287257.1 prolyl oligopeptidase family serine peptidase [Xanthomonas translucens pv. translucens]MCT8291359.1 prolyl oligopeptidase family serine peptidase [Xantho